MGFIPVVFQVLSAVHNGSSWSASTEDSRRLPESQCIIIMDASGIDHDGKLEVCWVKLGQSVNGDYTWTRKQGIVSVSNEVPQPPLTSVRELEHRSRTPLEHYGSQWVNPEEFHTCSHSQAKARSLKF